MRVQGDLVEAGGGGRATVGDPPRVLGRQPRELGWQTLVAAANELGPDPALADLDDADLRHEVLTGAVAIAAATARWLELVADLVVRGIWSREGATSPGAWLGWACGMASSTAREHVRVALRLRELPRIAAAFAEGRVSYSKVRAVTRVAEPEIEEALLAWCDAAPAATIERVVAEWRANQTVRMPQDEAALHEQRHLSSRRRADGMWEVRLVLPEADVDALLANVGRLVDLERRAEAEARRASGEEAGEWVQRPAALVDAVVRAVAQAVDAGPVDTSGRDGHTVQVACTLAQLQAGGASAEAEAEGGAGPVPSDVTASTQAASGVVAEDVSAGASVQPGTARDGPAADASAEADAVEEARAAHRHRVLRRIACDAGVVAHVARHVDDPDAVASARVRVPSKALRRQLDRRDGGCRFPGCSSVRHLHAHHVVHWADGGPTTMANLVLLCGHHHRHVHANDVAIRHDGHGRFAFDVVDARVGSASAGAPRHLRVVPDEADRPAAERLMPRWWDGGRADLAAVMDALHWQLEQAAPPEVDVLPALRRRAA